MTWNNRWFLLFPVLLVLVSFDDTSPTLSELKYRKIEGGLEVSFKAKTALPLDLLVNVNFQNVINTTTLGNTTYKFEVAESELRESEDIEMEFNLGDLHYDITLANPTKKVFQEDVSGNYVRVLSLDFNGKEVKETLRLTGLDFELWSDMKSPSVMIAKITSSLSYSELSSYDYYLNLGESKYRLEVVEIEGNHYMKGVELVTPSEKRLSNYVISMGNDLLKYEGNYLVRKALSDTTYSGEYGIFRL